MKAKPSNGHTGKTPSVIEAFLALSDEEKEKIYKSLDQRTPDTQSEPVSPKDLANWKKAVARSQPGRPKIGTGARRVQVTIEGTLLRKADTFARKHGMTRAQLVAKGLRLAIR